MPHRNLNIPNQTMPPPKPDPRPSRAPKSMSWQHMADTYAWVVEQEYVKLDKHGRNTEQWIREQQIRFPEGRARHEFGERVRRRMWEDTMYRYEAEAERWMRQEEEMRRIAAERERRRAKAMQEEVRREEQIRHQRDAERRKRTEEYHYYRKPTERKGYERSRSDKSLADSWKRYEDRWATLAASLEPLTFANIPWPLASPPTSPEQITLSAVSEFLLSPLHSQSLTRKDRIRNAQLRWHPDRFQRMMHRVPSTEKATVTEGVGAVARSLNELMSREKASSRSH